jgi:hypothetical protein
VDVFDLFMMLGSGCDSGLLWQVPHRLATRPKLTLFKRWITPGHRLRQGVQAGSDHRKTQYLIRVELGVSPVSQTVAREYTHSAAADESEGRHEVRQ